MVRLGKDFKYKKIENFLSEEEVLLFQIYSDIRHKNNLKNFDYHQTDTCDTYYYVDPLAETLLCKKIDLMEKETGLSLHPSYSFWRTYTYLSDLRAHKDRPSCEISVTVMIGSDGTKWPIYMEGEPIDLNPGDAVIYLGHELEHWREEFEGDWHTQVFLHYVRQDGPHKDFKFDRKSFYGRKEI
jgi:hypothetical protein